MFGFLKGLVIVWLTASGAGAAEMVGNGGFEPPFEGGIAHEWADNSYTKYVVRYSEEASNVHGGLACQKVEALSFTPDSGIQFCQNVPLRPGRTYTISVWMRAEGIVRPVTILLRRGPPLRRLGRPPLRELSDRARSCDPEGKALPFASRLNGDR